MKGKISPLLSVLFLSLGIFSCSRTEPRILYGFIDLVYYPGEERPEERYSFFILPEDDDGMENLSELLLYHDREGLRWRLEAADWARFTEAGKTWIGTRSIAMRDDGRLPRGQYRAVLINKGGERTERAFTFDGPEEAPYPFPFFSISSGVYRIDSEYPVNKLICYNQEGEAVQTVLVTEIQGNIRDLRLSNNVRSAALWAEDPDFRISALTEAVSTR